ncbi:MAG: thiamine pyrophosphate-dependent enzyme [Dehalococcoidia bacterium]
MSMSESGPCMSLDAALHALARRRRDQVVVATMTAMAPWRKIAATDRDIGCVGFMGGASTLGLGIALARPDVPVWIIDGDGSLTMQLGSLMTIANAAPRRFLHVVMRNGVYDTSGAQPILGAGTVSFAALAEAAGYARGVRFEDAESFDAALDELIEVDGPVLVELITQPTGAGYVTPPPATSKSRHVLAMTWPVLRDALRREA